MDSLIYERQKNLQLNIPCSVAVIGVGGVGFWVSTILAMTGVKKIILFDGDKIELLNLNRIPATTEDVGMYKVNFTKRFLQTIRTNLVIIAINEHFTKEFCYLIDDETFVYECTDDINTQELTDKLFKDRIIHIHYNGYDRISIEEKLSLSKEWNNEIETNHYQVIPSFVAPAMISAGLGVFYTLTNKQKMIKNLIL